MKPQLMEQCDISCLAEFDPAPSNHMYYVYVLKDGKRKKLYYGYTNNLKRRLEEHKKRQMWILVYYEAYRSESNARRRERQLKHYAQALTALKTRLKEPLAYLLGVGFNSDKYFMPSERLHKVCPH